jgi:hypothetical protein
LKYSHVDLFVSQHFAFLHSGPQHLHDGIGIDLGVRRSRQDPGHASLDTPKLELRHDYAVKQVVSCGL